MNETSHDIRKIRFAGLTHEEYNLIEKAVLRNCRHSLITGTFVGTALLLILTVTALFVSSLSKNLWLYATCFVSLAAIYTIGKLTLKQKPAVTPIFSYAFLTVVFLFGIVLGVPLSLHNTAVTICVMLFALPLLLSDRPLRIDAYLIIVTIIFCVYSKAVKPSEVSSIDITNAVSFLFLSIVVNYHVTKSKFNGLLMRYYVEKERDTDGLTQLMTKAAFKRDMDAFARGEGKNSALMVIDIDNFKGVNDTMGHAYGDAVLRIMGECIRETFEKPCLLGRFGGDEFVILLPGRTDKEKVAREVTRLIGIMDKKLSSDNVFKVTGSIGIALMPEDADNFEALFKRADEALYESKKKGKNCYTFYFDGKMTSEK